MKKENQIFCNMCGKDITIKNGIPMEEVLSVKKMWGYFSTQDGVQYEFELCETCCRKLLEQFQIPAAVTEGTELL